MKIANIIIAHKNPMQLKRLVRQFHGSLFHNFIHIDARCDIKEYESLQEDSSVTMLPNRKKLVWAGSGFVDVILEAMQMGMQSNNYFYYNVISGMDFPIKPTADFHRFLKENYNSEKNEYFEILDLSIWPGAHRYERFHLTDWTIKGRYFLERLINWTIPKRKFYYGKFTPYGRSAFFTATDKFVSFTLKFLNENPDYMRFLKTTWSPDEFIFNTLIMNSPFRDRVADNHLRYIDWSEKKVSPLVFRSSDFNRLSQRSEFLARKFDETIDCEIIDRLEQHIIR